MHDVRAVEGAHVFQPERAMLAVADRAVIAGDRTRGVYEPHRFRTFRNVVRRLAPE